VGCACRVCWVRGGKREMGGNVGASEILYVLWSLITPCHASDGCFDTSPSEVHRLGQVM
jgi:hypothetical protein